MKYVKIQDYDFSLSLFSHAQEYYVDEEERRLNPTLVMTATITVTTCSFYRTMVGNTYANRFKVLSLTMDLILPTVKPSI